MGFIRGSFLFFLVALLISSLTLGNLFLTLTLSLEYDIIQPKVVSFIQDFSQENFNVSEGIEDEFEKAKLGCQGKSVYSLDYGNGTLDIPCEVILKGQNETLKYGISQEFDKIYYEDYNCNPLQCVSEGKYYFLFSEDAKDYWKNKFYIFLALSILIIILSYFAVEEKKNILFVIGGSFILSSLPFMKTETFVSFLDESVLQFIPLMLSQAHKVFLISFSFGIFLMILWVLFKVFNLDEVIMDNIFKNKNETGKRKRSN